MILHTATVPPLASRVCKERMKHIGLPTCTSIWGVICLVLQVKQRFVGWGSVPRVLGLYRQGPTVSYHPKG